MTKDVRNSLELKLITNLNKVSKHNCEIISSNNLYFDSII